MFSAVTMALKKSSGTSTKGIHPLNEKQQETDPALALSAVFLAKTPSGYTQRGFFLF
jgi:hypothetical protein